jgi:Mg/Co/Ni transporter MgtE
MNEFVTGLLSGILFAIIGIFLVFWIIIKSRNTPPIC